jgi:sigma-B regulation protein RsbU (phosphoserine phosphatase)
MVTPGSRLYLFSDGVYEIDRPDDTMMTHEEFSMILKDPVESGHSKMEAIVAEVRRQQGKNEFADDFSLTEFTFLKNGDQAS